MIRRWGTSPDIHPGPRLDQRRTVCRRARGNHLESVLPQLLDQRRQFSPTTPGENTGPADGPYIGYLKALRDWDRRLPRLWT